jgi:hypothetical protein
MVGTKTGTTERVYLPEAMSFSVDIESVWDRVMSFAIESEYTNPFQAQPPCGTSRCARREDDAALDRAPCRREGWCALPPRLR